MSSTIVLTRPISAGVGAAAAFPGLTTTVINGQPMLTLEDTTRFNKALSVSEQVLVFAESRLAHLDWISISTTADADSGYVADFDGTATSITAHCENTASNNKDIHLYIDSTDMGPVVALSGGANVKAGNQVLNVDFVQGQRIRLRAVGDTDKIEDTVIKLTIKWRG